MADPRDPISDVMSRGAVTVDERLTLRALAAVLAELDIGVALVRRPDGAVGVVSERDVVHALAAGADPEEVWAADVVSDDVVLAELQDTIVATAERMGAEGVRHIAAVDNGAIVGVVSARDVRPILTSHARSTI
jgi:predicted transcriptional regulator